MNIGFKELTFSGMWIPLSNGILNVVEAVFVSGVYAVFVSNLKESSISFWRKTITNFIWFYRKELHIPLFPKGSLKEDALSLYTMQKHSSCNIYFLFNLWL